MDLVELDGQRIAYHQAGSGRDLLLVHGGVTDGRSWAELLESLAHDFRVTAWDAPGTGGSSDPPDDIGTKGYADLLAGLIEALGLRHPHVVGHSWGSTLALSLHLRHPGAVGSLVLAGPYAGWAGSLPADEVARRLEYALGAAADLAAGRWEPRSMPGLFSDRVPPERAEHRVALMLDSRPAGMRAMARSMADTDLSAELARVTAPTLVLVGELDERSPVPLARTIHRAIAGSRMIVLPGTGHDLFVDDPGACEEAIRRFVDDLG